MLLGSAGKDVESASKQTLLPLFANPLCVKGTIPRFDTRYAGAGAAP